MELERPEILQARVDRLLRFGYEIIFETDQPTADIQNVYLIKRDHRLAFVTYINAGTFEKANVSYSTVSDLEKLLQLVRERQKGTSDASRL